MIQIVEGLYLGHREDARDLTRIEAAGITHVLNCTEELPNYHEGRLTYLKLNLLDPDPTFRRRILPACRFIDEARAAGRVLVHCFAAVSRSPSVVLAYLCHTGLPLDRAARLLAGLVWTAPDHLFLRQLADHAGAALSDAELRALANVLVGRAG
jgi:atypical dual specificity phosphatase